MSCAVSEGKIAERENHNTFWYSLNLIYKHPKGIKLTEHYTLLEPNKWLSSIRQNYATGWDS